MMSHRFRGRVPFFLILLLAFAIRVYHLDGQSMWSDEGLSLYRIHQPVSQQLQNIITVDGVDTRDTNPPFYFLLLHGWNILTGDTIFALRYGGVLLALLSIPLIYRLTALVSGENGSLAAAFLLAISPFHIWQSQILRNYGLLITLNLLCLYGLWRFIKGGPQAKRWLWLWAVAGLLGIYSHYFGFFIFAYGLVALTVTTASGWGKQRLSSLFPQRWFWAGLILSLLILLPAIYIGLDRFRAGQQIDFNYIPTRTVAYHALGAFAVGVSPSLSHPWDRLWPALLLALGGLFWLWHQKRLTALLVLGYQLIPLGLLQLLSLFNPLYNGTRHLLIGLPPFLILLATGVMRAPTRWLRVFAWGLGIITVVIQLNWLYTQFTSLELVRDDVRGAALYLNEHAAADDLIILHDTLIGFTFAYYYEGAAAWRAIPLYGEQDVAAAMTELENAAADTTGRLWFLTRPTPRTGFPETTLSRWANQQWSPFWTQQFHHMWLPVRLEAYLPNPGVTTIPPTIPPQNHTFSNILHLQGLALPTTLATGEDAWIQSYWSQTNAQTGNYALSFRWQDETGQVWVQQDTLLSPTSPPAQWPQTALMRFDQVITLPASIPPGQYTIWLRLIDPQGNIMPTAEGTLDIHLGEMTLTPGSLRGETALATLPPFTHQQTRLGPLTFLGYQLPPTTQLRPGHILPLELFWQAQRTPTQDYQLRTRLLNEASELLSEILTPLTRPHYPTSLWTNGTVIQGKVTLLVPGTSIAQEGRVEIALVTVTGDVIGQPILLPERLSLIPWPLVTELPPIPFPQAADFGDPPLIHLPGYDLSTTTAQPDDIINLTLYWQVQQNIATNYLIFVHLTDTQNNIVAQTDGIPVNGVRLTMSWRANEVLVDEHLLTIGTNVAPGTYQLWVGFYDPETGIRVPVTGTDADSTNNRVLLDTITIIGK